MQRHIWSGSIDSLYEISQLLHEAWQHFLRVLSLVLFVLMDLHFFVSHTQPFAPNFKFARQLEMPAEPNFVLLAMSSELSFLKEKN